MRRILPGDLMMAARALMAVPAPQRRAHMDRMLAEAHAAHLYAKRFGRGHPHWGNGSLMARALAQAGPLPASARLPLALLALVIERVLHWRG